MKKFFLVPFLLLLATVYADDKQDNGWTIVKNSALFSYTAEFGITKADRCTGKVVRTGLFTPRYYYDLVDANNQLQVRGITRAFSLGMLFAWGMEIDLYDADHYIGMIQGKIFTSSRAKFVFYNGAGDAVANAYLNDETCNFLIVSAQNEGAVIAELKGKAYGDSAIWEMKPMKYPLNMDERALQIFAGFVSDYQKDFVRPPKKEVYYYYDSRRN